MSAKGSKDNGGSEIGDLLDLLNAEERKIYDAMTEEDIVDYKEIFNIFDTDGGGSISSDEVSQVMRTLG